MEKFFAQGGLTEEQLRAGEHAAVQKQSIIPLFCTNATGNIGVARLMDFIAKYGSSPVDREHVSAIDLAGKKVDVALNGAETAAYIFKTMSEAQFGELSYFRVYSGHVHAGMDLYKWSVKLGPLVPGDVLLDAFELARDILTLDMRASPYDLTAWGYTPVAIETPEGKATYVGEQRGFAARGQALRARLLAILDGA